MAEQLRANRVITPFFVTGGTMRPNAESYVERSADAELYETLKRGDFCYILDTRQMGKSSLMARVAYQLRREKTAVATIDLQSCGSSLSPEQWYNAQLLQIGEDLDLEDEILEYWNANPSIGSLDRWKRAIRKVVMPRVGGRLVIFIDEIDFVRSLPFPTDEFFAGIRGFYNERALDAEMEKLTFCLVGVATPTDLIRAEALTPFNLGRRIDLADFTEKETVDGFARGFVGLDPKTTESVLKRIWYWTEGHPYLTQRLCEMVAQGGPSANPETVDKACETLFLGPGAREQNDNLRFVANRMLAPDVDAAAILDLYAKVRRDESVIDDGTNPLVNVLRLSGIARVSKGRLKLRNEIYRRVFDGEWIERNMPDQELQRQRAAYMRGLRRTGLIALAVIAFLSLGGYAYWSWDHQRDLEAQNKRITDQSLLIKAENERAVAAEKKALDSAAAAEDERRKAEGSARNALASAQAEKAARTAASRSEERALSAANTAIEAKAEAQAGEQAAKLEKDNATAASERAKAAERAAKQANADLQAKADELTKSNELSFALRLSAQADTDRSSAALTEPSLLAAIQGAGRKWTPLTYSSLLRGISLIPRRPDEQRWPVPIGSRFAISSPDNTVIIASPDDTLHVTCALDLVKLEEKCTDPQSVAKYPRHIGRYAWVEEPQGELLGWDFQANARQYSFFGKVPPDAWAVSQDGNFLAVADAKKWISIRTVSSGVIDIKPPQVKNKTDKDKRDWHPVQFSQKGEYLIVKESSDGRYSFWNTKTGAQIAWYSAADLGTLALSANGRDLFSPTLNKLLSIPPASGKTQQLRESTTLPTSTGAAAFSSSGIYFAWAGTNFAALYPAPFNNPIPFPQVGKVTGFAFSPDDRKVAVMTTDLVQVFETLRLQEVARARHPGVRWVAFRDDATLVTASKDLARAWNLAGDPQRALRGSATSASFLNGPGGLVGIIREKPSVSPDVAIQIWDLNQDNVREAMRLVSGNENRNFSISDVGRAIAGSTDGPLRTFQPQLGSDPGTVAISPTFAYSLSPRGRYAYGAGVLLDLDQAGKRVPVIVGSDGAVLEDDSSFVSVQSRRIQRWLLPQGSDLPDIPIPFAVSTMFLPPAGRSAVLQSSNSLFGWTAPASKFSSLSRTGTLLRVRGFGYYAAIADASTLIISSLEDGSEVYRQPYTSGPVALGKTLVVVPGKEGLDIVDIASRKVMATMPNPKDTTLLGLTTNESKAILFGNGVVQLYSTRTGKLTGEIQAATAAISPNGAYLITSSRPSVPNLFRPPAASTLTFAAPTSDKPVDIDFQEAVISFAASPDGHYAAAGGVFGTVKVIDLTKKADTGFALLPAPPHGADVTSLAISPDNRYIASASGQKVRVWEIADMSHIQTQTFPTRVMSVSYQSDGRQLAVGVRDGTIRILNAPTLHEVKAVGGIADLHRAAYSPDGKFLAARSFTNVKIWSLADWSTFTEFQTTAQQRTPAAAYSPDSRYYAFTPGDGIVQIWDLQNKGVQHTLPVEPRDPKATNAQTATLSSIIFSRDGEYLLAGMSDSVRIWSVKPAEEVGRIPEDRAVTALALSPDGKSVAISRSDGTLNFTKWHKDDLIAEACNRLDHKSMDDGELKRYFLTRDEYKNFCAVTTTRR